MPSLLLSRSSWMRVLGALFLALLATPTLASELDLQIPDLRQTTFNIAGMTIDGWSLLLYGTFVICGTLGISLYLRFQIHALPAHK